MAAKYLKILLSAVAVIIVATLISPNVAVLVLVAGFLADKYLESKRSKKTKPKRDKSLVSKSALYH